MANGAQLLDNLAMRSLKTVSGWTAFLLVPIGVLVALVAGVFARPKARSPQDVASLLNGFLDGADERAWDELESVPIADPFLETIRQRAIPLGPPNPDVDGLRSLLAELNSRYPAVG